MNVGKKIFLLSIVACMALSDQIIDTDTTSQVSSNGNENILVTKDGSIVTDSDNNINITETLGSDYNITNKGYIKNKSSSGVGYRGMPIAIHDGNDGKILNYGTIYANGMYDIYTPVNNGYIINGGDIYNNDVNTTTANAIVMTNNNNVILNNSQGSIKTNSNSIYVDYNNRNGYIENNGSIESVYGRGIYSVNYNKGTIVNERNGIIKSKLSSIYTIENDSNITNNGTLTSSDRYGIEITSTNVYEQGVVINNGLINGGELGGIFVKNNNNRIENNDGIQYGVDAIKVENNGFKAIILNNDFINDVQTGINVINNNSQAVIQNNGSIMADTGINISGENIGTVVIGDQGSIRAKNNAIYVYNNKNNIYNHGLLTASDGNAIYVAITNSRTSITNYGKINLNLRGISVSSNEGTILNDTNGEIYSTKSAIYIDSDNNGYITNNGILITNGIGGNSIEIHGNNNKDITNYGTIRANNNAIYIDKNNNGTIANHNTINLVSKGIFVNGTNNNLILNDTDGNITSDYASIYVNDNQNNVQNNGIIYSGKGNGIEIRSNHNWVTNNGTITARNSGIYIDQDNSGTVTNNNTIKSESKGITVNGSNNSSIFQKGKIISAGNGIEANINNSNIYNNGYIYSETGSGIMVNTNNNYIRNEGDGNITSKNISIFVSNNANKILNSGYLSGANSAINVTDNHGYVKNFNTIANSNYAIYVKNNYSMIENERDGVIKNTNNTGIKVDNNNGYISNKRSSSYIYSDVGISVNISNGEISNYGYIISNDTSIFVSDNNNTIINKGYLSGTNSAINVTDNHGNIKNSKSISNSNYAIYVQNNYNTIENSYYAVLESTNKVGIKVDNNNGSIINILRSNMYSKTGMLINTNRGSILNEGNIASQDIGIQVTNNEANITNNGTLSSSNNNHLISVIYNTGIITNTNTLRDGDIGIYTQENNNTLLNNGFIYSNIGIYTQNNNANITNNKIIASTEGMSIVTNNGTILNDTDGNITSNDSAILIVNNKNTIINSGYLSGVNSSINVTDNNGTIINNADIAKSSKGINVINNNKDIINNARINSEIGIYVTTNNGSIINGKEGNITADNTAIYIAGDDSNSVINNGNINAKYTLNSYSKSGMFTNNATAIGGINAKGMDVVNNGTLILNPNQVIKAKTFTQNSNGKLQIGLFVSDTNLSAQVSEIGVQNNIVFKRGSTINIMFVNTTNKTINDWLNTLKNSSKYTYKMFSNDEGVIAVTENGKITADIDHMNFIDNSALLVFSAENNGTSMNLLVKKTTDGLETLVNEHGEAFEIGAAKALDKIFGQFIVNDDIGRYLTLLDSKSTDNEKTDAIAESIPVNVLSTSKSVLYTNNAISSTIEARQRGLNSGNALFKDRNLWIKPYYTYTTQNDRDGYRGFTSHTSGFVLGADGDYGDAKRAGIAFSYGHSEVNTNGLSQSSKIDNYTFIAYGTNPMNVNEAVISYQFGIGMQKINSKRFISTTNQTATASYNPKLFYAQAIINKNVELKEKFVFVPRLKLSYKYYHSPSYSETGAGGMGLNVQGFNTQELVIGTGGLFKYALSLSTDISAYGNIEYNTINDRETVSASFQGANDVVFETGGIKNSPLTFNGGMMLNKKMHNHTSFSFGININKKTTGFTSKSVFAKYNIKF
ncbi:autotransporter domain-containing protein [Nautilia lithotrophica]